MPPSPPDSDANPHGLEKARLRKRFRQARRDHVTAIPASLRALILNRPPTPLLGEIAEDATIGLYYPVADEAPTLGWARWLAEHGRKVALPAFAERTAAMTFRIWSNPFDSEELAPSPWGGMQPADGEEVVPDLVVTPLIAFTADGHRLGQGGGHYDRWFEAHAQVRAIGLGWDCQLAEALPVEAHDHLLSMIVTPTRIYDCRI